MGWIKTKPFVRLISIMKASWVCQKLFLHPLGVICPVFYSWDVVQLSICKCWNFCFASPKWGCKAWFCVSTWHSWSYHRERSFSWGNTSMRSSCKAFSQLVIKGEGPIVSGAIPGLVVLGSIRKQAEKARGNKPVSSIPPCVSSSSVSSCLDFLWWLRPMWK